MKDSMLGILSTRDQVETDALAQPHATDREPAPPTDGAKEPQDHQREPAITTMRPSLETGAPHPHLTHSMANTTPTEIISATETEPAQCMDGAKENQDDLHPNQINSIFYFYCFDSTDFHWKSKAKSIF